MKNIYIFLLATISLSLAFSIGASAEDDVFQKTGPNPIVLIRGKMGGASDEIYRYMNPLVPGRHRRSPYQIEFRNILAEAFYTNHAFWTVAFNIKNPISGAQLKTEDNKTFLYLAGAVARDLYEVLERATDYEKVGKDIYPFKMQNWVIGE